MRTLLSLLFLSTFLLLCKHVKNSSDVFENPTGGPLTVGDEEIKEDTLDIKCEIAMPHVREKETGNLQSLDNPSEPDLKTFRSNKLNLEDRKNEMRDRIRARERQVIAEHRKIALECVQEPVEAGIDCGPPFLSHFCSCAGILPCSGEGFDTLEECKKNFDCHPGTSSSTCKTTSIRVVSDEEIYESGPEQKELEFTCVAENDIDGDEVPDGIDKCDNLSGVPNKTQQVYGEFSPNEAQRGCDMKCPTGTELVGGTCVKSCPELTRRDSKGQCECSFPGLKPITDKFARDAEDELLTTGKYTEFLDKAESNPLYIRMRCMEKALTKIYETGRESFRPSIESVFRPQKYQEHLHDVWSKNKTFRDLKKKYKNFPQQCQAAADEVANHAKAHHIGSVEPAVKISQHTFASAIDYNFSPTPENNKIGSSGQTIDDIATSCQLCRPFPPESQLPKNVNFSTKTVFDEKTGKMKKVVFEDPYHFEAIDNGNNENAYGYCHLNNTPGKPEGK